jgi:hypothetical protein
VGLRLNRTQGLVVAMVALLATGCNGGSGSDDEGDPNAESTWDAQVDPQILQDAVEGAYWMPGSGVLRGMRVQTFLMSIGVGECGGEPIPIDSTQDRPAQNLYPDLELIRERGFVEQGPSYRDALSDDCEELAPDSIESWGAWRDLTFQWEDEALTVQEEAPTLEEEKTSMTDCLVERTGLNVDEEDPTTFLRAVDDADVNGATDQQMKDFAIAYADCGQTYFDAFAAELQGRRKDLIERNRETLARFAVEIADAGYVP